jgi:hypothetical protein
LKVKKSVLFGAFALLTALFFSACKNPSPLGSDSRGDDDNGLGETANLAFLKDSLSGATDSKTYKFTVTPDKAYTIQWDDMYGSGAYTCDIRVSAYAYYKITGFSSPIYPLFINKDSAYSTPFRFTALEDSRGKTTVTLEVSGLHSSSGTFGIIAYADSDAAKTNLLEKDSTNYWGGFQTIADGGTKTFSMPVSTSNNYFQWDDAGDGSGLCSADITVSVTHDGGVYFPDYNQNYIENIDSGYSLPVYFNNSFRGTATVTVTCKTPGTYRIRAWSGGDPTDLLY